MDKILEITNKTMLPASLIVVGWLGIAWVIDVKKSVDLNASEIETHKVYQTKIIEKLEKNGERLARIEASIEFIRNKIK